MTLTRRGRTKSTGALLTAMLIGCMPSQKNRQVDATLPEPNRHWLQDEQLRGIMAEITKQYPVPRDHAAPDHKTSPELRKWMDEVRGLAVELRQAAERIPRVVASVRMTPADRAAFKAQADTLGDQATTLERAARRGDVDAMHEAMVAIGATCASCHTRFRDYSGLLGTQQTRANPIPPGALTTVVTP